MSEFVDILLLGSWTERDLKKQIRLKYNTFIFLYQKLGLYLKKEDIQFRGIMPVQERVVMSLHRLGSNDALQSIGDLYGVHKSTLSKIVREFYRVGRRHLQPSFVQILNESYFEVLASRLKKTAW